MSKKHAILNENEKISMSMTGIESNSKTTAINEAELDNVEKRQMVNDYNETVDKYTKDLENYNESLVNKDLDFTKLEIMPIDKNILIIPYKTNPFQKIKTTESGLIVDMGGKAPVIKSNETGELEEEKSFIRVGVVIEVGRGCDYVKEGDVVMWTKPSEIAVPFFRQGFIVIHETRVLAVINEGLKERFNKTKLKK